MAQSRFQNPISPAWWATPPHPALALSAWPTATPGKASAPFSTAAAASPTKEGDGLAIDLHIIVTYGLNISAIVKSIVNKVRYTVEEATGFEVRKVNVFVDGMKS